MAIKDIVTIPDPVLRRKAHKVTVFDKDFQTFVDDMVDTLRDAPGVGLAAPQVGVSQRLIVIEYSEDEDEDEEVQEDKPAAPKKLYIVANPEIIAASEETEKGIEGCLSVPDLVGEVERSLHLTVKGLNRRGKPIKIKADGWLARIFQHEIDHLDGVIFTDKALKVWQPREDEKVSD